MKLNVFTDGASRGNPGDSSLGVAIYEGNVLLDEISSYLGKQTNNYAEYMAVLRAFEWIVDRGYRESEIEIFSDSQLLVKQLSGEYKVKSENIKPIFSKISLMKQGMRVKFTWVRREENTVADSLANKALDEKD